MSSSCRPLTIVGDANPDLVLRGDVAPRFGQAEQLLDGADLVMGGSASITACGAARLGIPTSLVACVGDDLFGRFVIDILAGRGVDVSGVEVLGDAGTGLSVILSAPGDRAILTRLGAIPRLTVDSVRRAPIESGSHVHASSFFLLPHLAAGLAGLFAELRARGVTTSVDTNWDPAERWAGVDEVLRNTDLFLPNDAELAAVGRSDDLDRAASRLVDGYGCAVVAKCGGDGGRAWFPDGSRLHQCPAPIAIVDTTGAGDSFNTGWFAGWLRGEPPARCLAMAVAAGGLSTQGPGGIGHQATWEELVAEADRVAGA